MTQHHSCQLTTEQDRTPPVHNLPVDFFIPLFKKAYYVIYQPNFPPAHQENLWYSDDQSPREYKKVNKELFVTN